MWEDIGTWSKGTRDLIEKIEERELSSSERADIERLEEERRAILSKTERISYEAKELTDELCKISARKHH